MDKETLIKINELGKFVNYPYYVKENDGSYLRHTYNRSNRGITTIDEYDNHVNNVLYAICRVAINHVPNNIKSFIKQLIETKQRDNYIISLEILHKLTIKDRKIYDNSKKLNKNLNHLYKKNLKYGFK